MCIHLYLKVELKEGDISLESNVWQGQCIEDLQMQVNKNLCVFI